MRNLYFVGEEFQIMANQNITSKWEITANRYVAFIDIMGFKDMVARNDHETIYAMMKKVNQSQKLNTTINWSKSHSDLISTTTYSDSIMIYSKDESIESLESIISSISSFSNDLFVEGIPHKGSLAFGKMTLDLENSIFFGQPLIDAYLLQEELNFYGIIFHASAEIKIDEFKPIKNSFSFTVYYLCNLKNGNSKHLTICPMYSAKTFRNNPLYKSKVDLLFNAVKKLRHITSGHLRKYIDATELYIEQVHTGEIYFKDLYD